MRRIHYSLKHNGFVFKTHPNTRRSIVKDKLERSLYEGSIASGI